MGKKYLYILSAIFFFISIHAHQIEVWNDSTESVMMQVTVVFRTGEVARDYDVRSAIMLEPDEVLKQWYYTSNDLPEELVEEIQVTVQWLDGFEKKYRIRTDNQTFAILKWSIASELTTQKNKKQSKAGLDLKGKRLVSERDIKLIKELKCPDGSSQSVLASFLVAVKEKCFLCAFGLKGYLVRLYRKIESRI